MILFHEDWSKYPEAVVHLNTRNRSAIKLAVSLKRMGVKNHAFMLALHNPMLMDVDPSDSNLDINTKRMIIAELQVNPWYYFREVCRVPAKGAPEPIRFELNRANVAVVFLFFAHLTSFLIQPRQTGKSLTMDLLYVYILMYGALNTDIDVLTKDEAIRSSNIDRLKGIIDSLPEYLNLRTKKDSFNNYNITVNANNNKLTMHLGQKSQAGAKKVGRGLSSNIVGIDEINFISNIDITLPTLLSVMTAAADNSKLSGMPYGKMYYSTPGFLNDPSGRYGHSLYKKAFDWRETYYDLKDEETLIQFVIDNSGNRSPIVLLEYNHLDLGYTDEWLMDKLANAETDRTTAEADYLMIWASGSDTSILEQSVIKRLNNSICKPLYTEISPQGLLLEWYIPVNKVSEYKNKSIVFGLDTSEAIGSDDIGLIGRDPVTGAVLCKGKYNKMNLNSFGVFIHWVLMTYMKGLLVIERRSSAMGILDHLFVLLLADKENIFKRVFNWIVQDPEKYRVQLNDLSTATGARLEDYYNDFRGNFGFATSGSGATSRKDLYSKTFIASTKYTAEYTYDRELVSQMVSLEKKNGRVDHGADAHDDLVIGYLLGYWLLEHGKNTGFYGILAELILSNVRIQDDTVRDSKNREAEVNKINKMVEELNDCISKLATAKNPRDAFNLELRIKKIKTELSSNQSMSMNTDQIISEISNPPQKSRSRINLLDRF